MKREQIFRAALFDLDGTLIDTEGQYTTFWGREGRAYVPDIPDFAQRIKGTTLANILSTYFPGEERRAEIKRRLDRFERGMSFPTIAGAERFVADIKARGVRCAIVTSSNRDKLACVRRAQPAFLTLFDAILTAEDFRRSKPDPDCYLRAADRLGADARHCVVFEDAPNGLVAGTNAGMFVVGLATGNPEEDVAPLCNYVVPDFTGITYDDINRRMDGKNNRHAAD
ncbi:MAG: HAD family phosphatase [Prevotella sp.]|nr:HAD family phosphatase [Prevotella sp.]